MKLLHGKGREGGGERHRSMVSVANTADTDTEIRI